MSPTPVGFCRVPDFDRRVDPSPGELVHSYSRPHRRSPADVPRCQPVTNNPTSNSCNKYANSQVYKPSKWPEIKKKIKITTELHRLRLLKACQLNLNQNVIISSWKYNENLLHWCIGSLLNFISALLNVRLLSNPPFAFWLLLTLDTQILVVKTKTCMLVVVLSIRKVNCTLPYTVQWRLDWKLEQCMFRTPL